VIALALAVIVRSFRAEAWQEWQGSAFARVRSRSLASTNSLQTGNFERTGANGREHRWLLPCRRPGVRVPSSALIFLQSDRCRSHFWQRWPPLTPAEGHCSSALVRRLRTDRGSRARRESNPRTSGVTGLFGQCTMGCDGSAIALTTILARSRRLLMALQSRLRMVVPRRASSSPSRMPICWRVKSLCRPANVIISIAVRSIRRRGSSMAGEG
jgi:hypothetical protein